ncbi:Formin-binding protein 1-like [Pseudolycoriella hygida]|uniref:Formin-binding protein 1-like n=1 Tax=Pseudolycoriella hygida TaxID=35572 RepID=A0A9Q0N536_9DIPT|nr:Formin-binding protein 1-like [Pseudolycoriella hygida]
MTSHNMILAPNHSPKISLNSSIPWAAAEFWNVTVLLNSDFSPKFVLAALFIMPNGPTLRNRGATISYKESTTYQKKPIINILANKAKASETKPTKKQQRSPTNNTDKELTSRNVGRTTTSVSSIKGVSISPSNSSNTLKERLSLNTVSSKSSLLSTAYNPSSLSGAYNPSEESSSLSDRISTLEARIESLASHDSRLSAIEAANKGLTLEIKKLQELSTKLEEELERVRFVLTQVIDLESKVESLGYHYKQVTGENAGLKTEVSQLKSEIEILRDQLQRFEEAQVQTSEGISVGQQEINSNIIIRGVDLEENVSKGELLDTFNQIRLHLGIAEVEPDQYDNLASHTQRGIEFLDKYGNFVRDRCSIEQEYAAKLRAETINLLLASVTRVLKCRNLVEMKVSSSIKMRLVKNYQPKKKEEEDNE